MPRGTPKHGVRLPDALWDAFGELAAANGTDRTVLIRSWVEWYVGQPDAKAPRRPRAR